jgi:hypothetical protein
MANVVINGTIPSDGNPEGVIVASSGALFYKFNGLYKISYGGYTSGSFWQNVSFQPFTTNVLFQTVNDINSIPTASNGTYLYAKETGNGSMDGD